jgi:hypothetical protein
MKEVINDAFAGSGPLPPSSTFPGCMSPTTESALLIPG